MGLIINQGKQDVSKDKDFTPITSEHEVAQITKIELDEKNDDRLVITMKIIGDSDYKNRLLWDRVAFKGEYSWSYRNLRKAAGVPYKEDEGAKIDIDSILLNKAVNVKLGIRKGNDGTEYQDIKYIMASTPKITKEEAEELPFDVDEDLVTDDNTEW